MSDDIFIDTFRYLHPTQREAYTCWETLSNARVNNYGVRIDYILCDGKSSKEDLVDCQHRTEIESSDHCPVTAEFRFVFKDRTLEKPPSICTKFWPEFKGTQMKMNLFVTKTKRTREEESEIIIEKTIIKQSTKKPKSSDQSSLFQHFKRITEPKMPTPTVVVVDDDVTSKEIEEKPKNTSAWNQIFRPPTPPPLCSGHKERCVIRQVKDASSANWGRYFYVCCRANGASDNPEARCDHFQWKEIKKKKTMNQ